MIRSQDLFEKSERTFLNTFGFLIVVCSEQNQPQDIERACRLDIFWSVSPLAYLQREVEIALCIAILCLCVAVAPQAMQQLCCLLCQNLETRYEVCTDLGTPQIMLTAVPMLKIIVWKNIVDQTNNTNSLFSLTHASIILIIYI